MPIYIPVRPMPFSFPLFPVLSAMPIITYRIALAFSLVFTAGTYLLADLKLSSVIIAFPFTLIYPTLLFTIKLICIFTFEGALVVINGKWRVDWPPAWPFLLAILKRKENKIEEITSNEDDK